MVKLLLVNWNVDPILFHIGSVEIRYYSLLFLTGFVVGMYIFSKMLMRENKDPKLGESLFYIIFFSTLIGARLGHCLFYEPDIYLANPVSIFWPVQNGKWVGYQGLASHGAAVGILIGIYYFSKRHKLPYLWTLDHVVITVALAGMFIRLGNLMNSEIYGIETSLPWGFVFQRMGEVLPKHPTQLYEALAYLLIFIFLYRFYLKRKPDAPNGVISGWFLILLFVARFLIEFIKEPQVANEYILGLNRGQQLSIPFIIIGVVILYYVRKKNKK